MEIGWERRGVCPLCGAKDFHQLLSMSVGDERVRSFIERYYEERVPLEKLEGMPFEVGKCRSCAFLFQSVILDHEGMDQLYDCWISAESSLRKKREGELSLFEGYAREAALISRLLDRRPCDLRVLDFGMGWGYWCHMAAAFGYQAVGMELSSERISFARSRGLSVVESWEELEPESFHFINSEQVFEHIADPVETLQRLVTGLASGGVIRISVPFGENMEARLRSPQWRAQKDALHPLEHINAYSNAHLVQLGRSAGLEPLNVPPPTPPPTSISDVLREKCRRVVRARRLCPPGCTLYFRKSGNGGSLGHRL